MKRTLDPYCKVCGYEADVFYRIGKTRHICASCAGNLVWVIPGGVIEQEDETDDALQEEPEHEPEQ